MDPLAGLSLACNIMQVIQFSAETMAVFRRLNEGKSPDPYVEVNSQSLVAATERLKSTLNTRSVIHGVPRDASLLQVCNEVVLVADALHKHAQKSLPAKGESKTKLIRKSVAFQLKHRSATEKLSRQLDKLQHRMESEVLIDLRQTLKQDHSDLVDRLQALDKDLIDFRANLIAGQTRLEDLVDRESGEIKKTIADEAQKTRNYNSQSAQETRDFINATHKERINDAAYQQFLNSFRFVDINARRNTIEFSHPETFEWIFAEPEDSQSSDDVAPNWSSFPEWLRGGTGLYWISGKAGAGKSTLMKFLLESQRTRQILSENSQNTMVVSAFIWSLGSSMQKTLIGVLCTLLYDMFAQDRELCWCQFRGRQDEFHLKQESSDWSLQELVLLFSTVAENCPRPLCIFIDGLDEIDRSKPTEITRLMGWLESARNLKNLQLCVSSRPEPTFENRLQEHPHLRVQDLTAKDTERYVSDSLRGLESALKASPQDLQDLIATIVDRAEGVFLWAHLVVEHIRTDADYFPTWKMLVQRVDELPSGLHSMYKAMWERHNGDSDVYRAETASYLNTLLARDSYWNSDQLLMMMLKFSVNVQDNIFKGGQAVSLEFLVHECSRFDVRMVARCGGLVTTSGIPSPQRLATSQEPFSHTSLAERLLDVFENTSPFRMSFGHRSAADFLLETSTGQEILNYDRTSAIEHTLCQGKAAMCHSILTGRHAGIYSSAFTLTPYRHEFRSPQFASAVFDLTIEACQRRPKWTTPGIRSQRRGSIGANGFIWSSLTFNGFSPQLQNHLRQIPPDDAYLLQKQLLSCMCRRQQRISWLRDGCDLMVELLDCIRPEDLFNSTCFIVENSLVEDILCFLEKSAPKNHLKNPHVNDNLQRLFNLLLQKCGGIESLSKRRVLTIAPWHTTRPQGSQASQWGTTLRTPRHGSKGIDTDRHLGAILVETSIHDLFFAGKSPLRVFLSDDMSRIGQLRSQKLTMALQFEVQKDDSKQKYHVSRCVSKPINNTNLRMDLMELNARLCDSKLHVKVTSDLHNLAAEQDPATTVTGPVYDIPVDDVDTLFYHDKYLEQPTLDTTETLNYLIERGHLSEQRLDPVNPLRAFLDDDLKPQERAQFDEIDWSPEIDCECFERESRAVIESERRAGNLKAVAPFDGGMQLRKAAKKWWEEVKERV
ncbi:hypothetical protein PSPO01_02088 [Paraphaeosphaeria sporulosa]